MHINLVTNVSTTIRSNDYIPGLEAPDTILTNPHLRSQQEIVADTKSITRGILLSWFQFPIDHDAESRAIFVSIICRRFNTLDVLLLPQIWSAYQYLKHNVLLHPATNPTRFDWAALSDSLLEHPLCDINSAESNLLRSIGRSYEELQLAVIQAGIASTGLGQHLTNSTLKLDGLASLAHFIRYVILHVYFLTTRSKQSTVN